MNPNLPPMHRLRVRALPDDMVQKVLDQLVEGTPPEDLCGRLYERCLLLLGSGQCPPDHPVWEQACRRFGVMQKGVGLGTWQATFRAFCKEVARLPPHIRATLWKFVRGDGAAVPHDEFLVFVRFFTQETGTPHGFALIRRDLFPVVSQALDHFGARDPETEEFVRAWFGGDGPYGSVEPMVQLIDGHPRQGAFAIVKAIRQRRDTVAQRLLPALLAAGVPTETLVRDRETLLHYAVRMGNAYAVAQLLQAGADQTARNAQGLTAAEMVKKLVVGAMNPTGGWPGPFTPPDTVLQEIFLQLWPAAAEEWRAMSYAERRDAARDGWSPARDRRD